MLFKLLFPRHEGTVRRIIHEFENVGLFLVPLPEKVVFLLDCDYLIQLVERAAIENADNVGRQFDGGLMLLFDDLNLILLLDEVSLHPSKYICPVGLHLVHSPLDLLEGILLLQ